MDKKFNLDEEVICGHKVSTQMKKVWKVELDLLQEFIRVCNKYNLNYFLCGGSLLGAIRHNGFIPWDDDIDVGMLRDDYNKLLEIASKEFKKPLFFQTPYNDKLFREHAQLRNSDTSAILPSEINMEHNQGIFIDIFPFDEYPKTKLQCKVQKFRLKIISRIFKNYLKPEKNNIKAKIFSPIAKLIVRIVGFEKLYKRYEKICSKYNGKGSQKIFGLSFIYNEEKFKYDISLFNEFIEHKFEDLKVMIPKEYDYLLKQRYGNYMEVIKGSSIHGGIFFNPDVSYKEFLLELRKTESSSDEFK